MKKVLMLLVVFMCVVYSLSAYDVGLRVDKAGCSMSARPTAYSFDSAAISATVDFHFDNWSLSPFIGIGAMPISMFMSDGTKVSANILVPLVGIKGSYTIKFGQSPFSVPLGLSVQGFFPDTSDKYGNIESAINANVVFNTGISVKLNKFNITLGGNLYLLRLDTQGNIFYIGNGIQAGLYSGLTVCL